MRPAEESSRARTSSGLLALVGGVENCAADLEGESRGPAGRSRATRAFSSQPTTVFERLPSLVLAACVGLVASLEAEAETRGHVASGSKRNARIGITSSGAESRP